MSKQVLRIAFLCLAPLVSRRAMAQQPPAPLAPPAPAARQYSAEEEGEARVMLGEQFCDIARGLAQVADSAPATRQSAALLEAALRMNPYEPRYPRLLAEALNRLGDIDGAIKAWAAYRKLLPDDRVVQVKVIDLYLLRLQTNDAKIEYLKELLANPKLAPEVKAHVAASAVPLLDQRSRAAARAMLNEARAFYPLPEVAIEEWEMLPPDAPPAMRVPVLLDRLRANPADAEAVENMADLLAEAGLSEQALNWYAVLMDIHFLQGDGPSVHSIINSLAEQYRSGEITAAIDKADKVLQGLPKNPDLWLLRLTMQRNDESATLLAKAREVFHERVNEVAGQVLKGQGATTQPARQPAEGPSAPAPAAPAPFTSAPSAPAPPASAAPAGADAASVLPRAIAVANASKDPRLKAGLVNALSDLAWFELYFDHNAEAALAPLDSMRKLLPSQDPGIRRIEGWYDLVSAHPKEARAAFTKQQADDPLSALGLFILEGQENHPKEAEAIGRKIITQTHAGVLGAILYQATKGGGLKPTTRPALTTLLETELKTFPSQWLEAVRNPHKFYAMRAEPVKVGHKLGEPLLASITIQNTGQQDIAIGEMGLLKPTLIFDAQIRSANPTIFPGITVDEIMGRFVLRPGDSVSQVVRLDQGRLSDALRRNPMVTVLVLADMVSNPTADQDRMRSGAGGYPATFSKMFTRSAAPLRNDVERRRYFLSIDQATPGQKILAIELMGAFVREGAGPDAKPDQKALSQLYMDEVDKERSDPAPGVKIWASYDSALLHTGIEEQKVVDEMIASTSWESRLMGLVAARLLPPEAQRQIARQRIAKDPDVLVKNYAAAMLQLLPGQQPPASQTQPSTTQPAATQPSATRPANKLRAPTTGSTTPEPAVPVR